MNPEQKAIEKKPVKGFKTVRKNDTGENVIAIQKKLKTLGFYKGAVDGKFGDDTEKAVMAFQKELGKPLNGSVGPKTWEALEKSISKKQQLMKVVIEVEDLTKEEADILVGIFKNRCKCTVL